MGPSSVAARLLGLRVRIPPELWMSLSCERFILSGGSIYEGANHLSRGVLKNVGCLSVMVKPQ